MFQLSATVPNLRPHPKRVDDIYPRMRQALSSVNYSTQMCHHDGLLEYTCCTRFYEMHCVLDLVNIVKLTRTLTTVVSLHFCK